MPTVGDRLRDRVLRWLFQGDPMTATDDERKAQGVIALARDYYDGDQVVYLTTRQKAWLDLHPGKVKFVVNLSATVVDAVVERLRVTGFDVGQQPSAGETSLAETLWTWWTANRMDAVQTEVHRAAVRDGEAFILTAWNNAKARPDFVWHQRYVDRQSGGDSFGMWMEYENDDPFGIKRRAVKQWSEMGEDNRPRMRRTVYYPERIEKYAFDGEWRPWVDADGEEWPLPWVTRSGAPLGIPVAHFRNPGTRSELVDVIPLQDALNKAWLDILAASDSTAFRMLVVLGFVPTTDGREPADDGSNLLQIAPGQMLATRKKPSEVEVSSIEPSSLDPLLQVEERLVQRVAQVSDTPLSRFQFSGQVAAEGTLRQQETPLLAKIEQRQVLFGNAWEDMADQARRQAVTFGAVDLDLETAINTVWAPAAVRDQKMEIEAATAKRALGVPEAQLWSELGYDAAQIAEMLAMPEVRARLAAITMGMEMTNGDGATDFGNGSERMTGGAQ